MQTKSPLMDDFARIMQGAAGMAQAANDAAALLAAFGAASGRSVERSVSAPQTRQLILVTDGLE